MSETVFTQVGYTLQSLVDHIKMGLIGLPDIQRPFVWKNSKVRDLFDSMYKGYPVGYLLFWQNDVNESGRMIGTDQKQKAPNLVIVDGQQRLTSLYAVLKNVSVLRENFEEEKIHIAFNPLEETFEVADAAIRRNKAYIPSISILWEHDADIFEITEHYLSNLSESGEVSKEHQHKARKAIVKLHHLTSFPMTALELKPDIDDEAVSDVFVRINSKGTPLKQADFILTLMSVYWDEGRKELETFCRESRKPGKGKASPYNHFIEPSPDQLLRVAVGVAFKRARLKYVYSILRGKDLETEKFSDENREKQFAILQNAQKRTLNLQHWHDFMNCVRLAGFRSNKMISSKNNLLYTYVLYLIGRTEYKVPEFQLRRLMARWFFMSAVTGRYTGSPESAMEFDLARLRDVDDAQGFIRTLSHICDITLTNDFWAMSLPNDLATSSPSSPSLFAYNAALVLLNAPVLYSKSKAADLMDPFIQAIRSSVERHHLFPKGYLKKMGFTSTRDTNQIANYALVEWADNMKISDQSPNDYVPELESRFTNSELEKMRRMHALPIGWEEMPYKSFLEKRRELIAQIIGEGYRVLCHGETTEEDHEEVDISHILLNGESESVEFKSTLRKNLHTGEKDARVETSALKTIAGFLNARGGTLIIGVSDDGSPIGIQEDDFVNEDKMSLHLVNIVKARMGEIAFSNISARFDEYEGQRVLVIQCRKSPTPIFLTDDGTETFYVRTGPSTTVLSPSKTQEYIKHRFTT